MREERHDDDVDVSDARRDRVSAVEEGDAGESTHCHRYTWWREEHYVVVLHSVILHNKQRHY